MTNFKPHASAVFLLALSQLLEVLAIFHNVFDGPSEKRVLNSIYIGMFVTVMAVIIFFIARSVFA
jgi:hypothetical protein